jgi:hypothetical protein
MAAAHAAAETARNSAGYTSNDYGYSVGTGGTTAVYLTPSDSSALQSAVEVSQSLGANDNSGILSEFFTIGMTVIKNMDMSALTAITNRLQIHLNYDFGMYDFFNSAEWINLMNSDFSLDLPSLNKTLNQFNSIENRLGSTIRKGTDK